MKRVHEEDDAELSSVEEGQEDEPLSKRIRESDVSVLTNLREKYDKPLGAHINEELEKAREKYLVSYLRKVMDKLPMSKEIVESAGDVGDGKEGFLKMYSIAKTCVHSDIQLKKLMAFSTIFNMMNSLMGKYVHDKIIAPSLGRIINSDSLNKAFTVYQETVSDYDENSTETQLHCISYIIQTELEKNEPLKVPNPIYNRITQQMKAVSKYVTILLSGLATTTPDYEFIPRNIDETGRERERSGIDDEREREDGREWLKVNTNYVDDGER